MTSPQALVRWAIDLAARTLTPDGDAPLGFDIGSERKHLLLNGMDAIGLTLAKADAIGAYEARRCPLEPWLFG